MNKSLLLSCQGVAVAILFAVSACGGGGGGGSGSSSPPPPPPPPGLTLTFTASPDSIAQGESSTLTWTTTDAFSCFGSQGWSGNKPTAGSEGVSPSTTTTYRLTCSANSSSETIFREVTVTVAPPPPPPPPVEHFLLHSFTGGANGTTPTSLVEGSDGNLYGTTELGGASNNGTFFRLTPTGTYTVLHSFAGGASDGARPSSLIRGSDNNFYGTTEFGGSNGRGIAFRMTPNGTRTVLHVFLGSDGISPVGLVEATDGNFYGTTSSGGLSGSPARICDVCGTFFRITPAGAFTSLAVFGSSSSTGLIPSAPIQGLDGNFYGTTEEGGTFGDGTVYRMTPTGTGATLYIFGSSSSTDGASPVTPLLQATDGTFYGTTEHGGNGTSCSSSLDCGTIFSVTAAGAETILHSSTNTTSAPRSLLFRSDGNLYGLAGTAVGGQLFRLTLSGQLTALHNFSSAATGVNPTRVFVGNDGAFYGITAAGGSNNIGTVFKIVLN